MSNAILLALLVLSALTSGTLEGQAARVSLAFSTAVLDVGTPAVIDLLIDCPVDSCAAADINVRFNPQALQIDQIALGDFPTQTGSRAFLLDHQVDDGGAAFTLRYVTLGGGNPGSAGVGVLARITATALAEGLTELQFSRASIASLDGRSVYAAQTQVGTVLVRPIHQLQTLWVRAEAVSPDQVTVTAPDAAAVVSETVVGDSLLVEIDPADPAVLTFNAPGHLSCTTTATQGQTITLRAGDINHDGIVDPHDADAIGRAMDGTPQPTADINRDGSIDIFDLIHVGRNYGLTSGGC